MAGGEQRKKVEERGCKEQSDFKLAPVHHSALLQLLS